MRTQSRRVLATNGHLPLACEKTGTERHGMAIDQICVAITGKTATELLLRSAALLPEFPFQEFRLDALAAPSAALSELGQHVASHPQASLLATCRRVPSGGSFNGTPEVEMTILLEAARLGFRLVDLSLESAEALPHDAVSQLRAAGARVILSWHDFERTGDLGAVMERMRPFSPDFCKVVPTAASLDDSLPLLSLLRNVTPGGPRMIGVSMGEPGVLTRVLGLREGSAFTFAAATPEEATAPGQVAAKTLRELYRIDRIDEATRLFGVAGDPIRSSLSPLMHNTAFRETHRNAVYLPLPTADAGELFAIARGLGLAGISVTMPLKQAVLPCLDRLDPLAASIGAVNTVRLEPDGSYTGFNTDAAGITAPLEQRLPLRGARVLVLGAGGAARAAVFGCAERGARVSILGRNPAAAIRLAAESGAKPVTEPDLAKEPIFDVLLNATPAGMRGNETAMPLQSDLLRAELIFDLVYNPLETPLLQAARAQGIATISGAEMFVHQGARQFELWFGQPAPIAVMRDVVMNALERSTQV